MDLLIRPSSNIWLKYLNRHFTKDVQIVNKYMKNCSVLSDLRETKSHFTTAKYSLEFMHITTEKVK